MTSLAPTWQHGEIGGLNLRAALRLQGCNRAGRIPSFIDHGLPGYASAFGQCYFIQNLAGAFRRSGLFQHPPISFIRGVFSLSRASWKRGLSAVVARTCCGGALPDLIRKVAQHVLQDIAEHLQFIISIPEFISCPDQEIRTGKKHELGKSFQGRGNV